MAIFEKGDMFTRYYNADIFLVTTNCSIQPDGALTMASQSAHWLKGEIPGIEYILGRIITNSSPDWHNTRYGLAVYRETGKLIGGFQTRGIAYTEYASLDIIKHSMEVLFKIIVHWEAAHPPVVVMNFPAQGACGISREKVEPLISLLPNCVEVWENAQEK